MAVAPPGARQTGRQIVTDHEGFLRHKRFRWLKVSAIVCLVAIAGYLAADVEPRPNGGSWYGYTLGTIGALLIIWLAWLGVRKRTVSRGAWSLKGWTSAHVYLGLALVVVATLHSAFQFSWNVHTLAWALMMIVVISGIYGVAVYATLPALLSSNREQMTRRQMVEVLDSIDRQLHDAAQPLPRRYATPVHAALGENAAAGGLGRRLTGSYPPGATRAAIDIFDALEASISGDTAIQRVEALLQRRAGQLDRMRRHARITALLDIWLFVHVPATFALLAALAAHVFSVFFYW